MWVEQFEDGDNSEDQGFITYATPVEVLRSEGLYSTTPANSSSIPAEARQAGGERNVGKYIVICQAGQLISFSEKL
jgi:hypothetical protein